MQRHTIHGHSARMLFSCALGAGTCLSITEEAEATVILQGLSVFATDAQGGIYETSQWNTLGGDLIYNAWVRHNGSWKNGPMDADAAIQITLTPGEHHFEVWCEQTILRQHYGINLFFGSTRNIWAAPDISAYSELWTGSNAPATLPTSADTRTLAGTTTPGSGSTSWIDAASGMQITITDWQFGGDHPLYRDAVGSYNRAKSNRSDYVGRFTLTVSEIPAPGAAMLASIALAGGARRRRR